MPARFAGMPSTHRIVDPSDIDPEPFPESGMFHRQLTEALGCEELRVNAVTLEPGDSLAEHRHERQEELYVSLTGGTVVIDGEAYAVPAGGVVRIGSSALRYVTNRSSDETQRWLMIGAPAVGTIEDYGEYVIPDESG